jgi:hypothetical protein
MNLWYKGYAKQRGSSEAKDARPKEPSSRA